MNTNDCSSSGQKSRTNLLSSCSWNAHLPNRKIIYLQGGLLLTDSTSNGIFVIFKGFLLDDIADFDDLDINVPTNHFLKFYNNFFAVYIFVLNYDVFKKLL